MILSLKLTNVRSFPNIKFDFDRSVNLLVGPNGAGKTTVLESVALFGFGRLLSVPTDSLAIREGEEVGRLEAVFNRDERKEKIAVAITKKEKIVKIENQKISNSALIGHERAVLFNPETVGLVGGSPDVRRREIDMTVAQTDRKYVETLLTLKSVLRQRNGLLKLIALGRADLAALDFWDEKLIEQTAEVVAKRQGFLSSIAQGLGETHAALGADKDGLKIVYKPSTDYDRFAEALVACRESDLKSGTTTLGPHRDDFAFVRDSFVLKDHASRGEERLAALALKIEEAKFLTVDNEPPILILDDVFSELDLARRGRLAKNLPDGQIIISATDNEVVPEILRQKEKLILLEKNE